MDSVKLGSNPGVKGPYFGAASNPYLTLWAKLSLSAPAPTVSLRIPLSALEELKKGFSSPSHALKDILCPCTAFPSASAVPPPGLLLVVTVRG